MRVHWTRTSTSRGTSRRPGASRRSRCPPAPRRPAGRPSRRSRRARSRPRPRAAPPPGRVGPAAELDAGTLERGPGSLAGMGIPVAVERSLAADQLVRRRAGRRPEAASAGRRDRRPRARTTGGRRGRRRASSRHPSARWRGRPRPPGRPIAGGVEGGSAPTARRAGPRPRTRGGPRRRRAARRRRPLTLRGATEPDAPASAPPARHPRASAGSWRRGPARGPATPPRCATRPRGARPSTP